MRRSSEYSLVIYSFPYCSWVPICNASGLVLIEQSVLNRCTGLVKAILIGKNRWIQLKHKGIEIFREYQAKTRILSDLLDQHPTVGVKLIAHKQAGETGLVKPAEWLVHALTNDQAPASQADRARNGRQRTPASSNEHNNTPRQHWE